MPRSLWYRFTAPLIELSLKCQSAPGPLQRWELRLDGPVLELKLLNEDGRTLSTVRLVRNAPGDVSYEQTWPAGD